MSLRPLLPVLCSPFLGITLTAFVAASCGDDGTSVQPTTSGGDGASTSSASGGSGGAGGSGGTGGAEPSCTDSVQNGGEEGVDCGGPCVPCTDFVPAFPGAIGPAAQTPAGRGGELYVISSLADDGPGTLRQCVEASGPRICAFAISGEIPLTKALIVDEPFLTIAGHTAPSPGVTVRDHVFSVRTHDVVIQHMRFRLGLAQSSTDAFALGAGSTDVYNVITDHCSMTWGTDGSWDAYKKDGAIHDITMSHTIVAETLEPHALNNLWNEAPDATPSAYDGVVIAHNLMSNGSQRNPRVTGAGIFLVFNNVVFNWKFDGSQIDNGSSGVGGLTTSFVNNHYVTGPDRVNPDRPPLAIRTDIEPVVAFLDGNRVDDSDDPADVIAHENGIPLATRSPIDLSGYLIAPVADVKAAVLANVGARPADRDAVDARITDQVISCGGPSSGCGSLYLFDPADAGGFPTLAENTHALDPPDDPNGDEDGDGYTNLEEWLHTFYDAVQ